MLVRFPKKNLGSDSFSRLEGPNIEVTQENRAPEESLALESDSSAGSESDKEPDTSLVAGPSRPQCRAILPAHFREDSDGDGGVVCDICHMTEPVNMASETVFWVDCDTCGVWVHNYCAFNKNTATRKYVTGSGKTGHLAQKIKT